VDVTSPLRPAGRLNAAWEIADQILGIAMQAANQQQLAGANVVIRPNLGAHLSDDFTNLDSLMIAGEVSARMAVADVKAQIARMAVEAANNHPSQDVFRNTHFKFDALSLDQEWIVPVMVWRAERKCRNERCSPSSTRCISQETLRMSMSMSASIPERQRCS